MTILLKHGVGSIVELSNYSAGQYKKNFRLTKNFGHIF